MVTWDKNRVETYAHQILNSLIANPMASEELIAMGLAKKDDEDNKVNEWAERWADVAFDIAEVFAAEADQRDEDPECRLLEND